MECLTTLSKISDAKPQGREYDNKMSTVYCILGIMRDVAVFVYGPRIFYAKRSTQFMKNAKASRNSHK